MSRARKLKKAAKAELGISPAFLNFLIKHLAKIDQQRAAGLTNVQALAAANLDRHVKNHR